MISADEAPMTTSRWLGLVVKVLTSWHNMCALVNRTLSNCSAWFASSAEMALGRAVKVTFENIAEEDRSNHWKALWILRNRKRASGSWSWIRLLIESCGMTLEMNVELLFTILVFGFLRFSPSFPLMELRRELCSPKAGAFSDSGENCWGAPSLLVSWDVRVSFSLSLML